MCPTAHVKCISAGNLPSVQLLGPESFHIFISIRQCQTFQRAGVSVYGPQQQCPVSCWHLALWEHHTPAWVPAPGQRLDLYWRRPVHSKSLQSRVETVHTWTSLLSVLWAMTQDGKGKQTLELMAQLPLLAALSSQVTSVAS